MSAFPDWQKYAVYQKRPATGCIPTAYEMLLRAAGAQGIDFTTFQDDFDLDRHGGQPKNHFVSVADAVTAKWPNVEFACESFDKGEGAKKLAKIEDRLKQKQPVLVSLANSPNRSLGWHIMPVVDSDAGSLTLLHHVDSNGNPVTETITKAEFVHRHDNWEGGDEIAYLKKW